MLVSRRMFEWCSVREGNDLRNINIPPRETENHLQKKPVFNTMLVTDKGFFLNMMIFLFFGTLYSFPGGYCCQHFCLQHAYFVNGKAA